VEPKKLKMSSDPSSSSLSSSSSRSSSHVIARRGGASTSGDAPRSTRSTRSSRSAARTAARESKVGGGGNGETPGVGGQDPYYLSASAPSDAPPSITGDENYSPRERHGRFQARHKYAPKYGDNGWCSPLFENENDARDAYHEHIDELNSEIRTTWEAAVAYWDSRPEQPDWDALIKKYDEPIDEEERLAWWLKYHHTCYCYGTLRRL
jgi:hypothetical protein